ncbi:hypothetical protein HanIR_Chr16g0793071 [Helianthus annuus]|nr:hypothetical protein HanIR_Chr16g0793071 [Helianthus annuus]
MLILQRSCPMLTRAASDLIKVNVEPILEQYRPMWLGVSIIEGADEGITMELEMNWDGNPSIILDIKTILGVGLPVQRRLGSKAGSRWACWCL